jgi:hypothetical protein
LPGGSRGLGDVYKRQAQPTPRFDEPNTAALLQKMLQALPTNQPPH